MLMKKMHMMMNGNSYRNSMEEELMKRGKKKETNHQQLCLRIMFLTMVTMLVMFLSRLVGGEGGLIGHEGIFWFLQKFLLIEFITAAILYVVIRYVEKRLEELRGRR